MSSNETSHRIFLSHSSSDNILAKRIYRWLRDQAVSAWFDRIELRPGDSLMSMISRGITNADFLLVLITENSKRSRWVETEVSIAITKEINGNGPKVIPLLLEGCEIPTMLAHKIYISIKSDSTSFYDIIPGIFRDSYMMDIILNPDRLELDENALREELYEYIRNRFTDLQVLINNHDFNKKLNEITEKTLETISKKDFLDETHTDPAHIESLKEQIKSVSDWFPIHLPIYWANLSQIITKLAIDIFNKYGKNMNAIDIAHKSINNTLKYCHFIMASRIKTAIFSYYATKFGYNDIAAYVDKYKDYTRGLGSSEEKLFRDIFEIHSESHIAYIGLEVRDDTEVRDVKIYLSDIDKIDSISLQVTCSIPSLISDYRWYTLCVPQILANTMTWLVFGEGKPLHESDYRIGIRMEDYKKMGYS